MDTPRSSRLPAVPFALAILTGMALAGGEWTWIGLALPVALTLSALAMLTCRRMRPAARGMILLAALCAGHWSVEDAHHRARQRVAGWLPADGQPVEMDLVGRLLAAPEESHDGARFLELEGRPPGHSASGDPTRFRLKVYSPTGAPRSRLDGLRRGDRVRVWARIRRPRTQGNPGMRDELRSLLAKGFDATGSVKSERLVEIISSGNGSVDRRLDRIRVWARKRLDRALPSSERSRGVLGAMLLGDRAGLRPEVYRLLREAGLVHLIAISGLHVGLVILVLLGILRRVRLPVALSCLVAALGLIAFGFTVGARPSVLRAVGCACVLMLGRSLNRDGNPVNTLAAVVIVLVGWRPWLVWDPGFQLTFLATAGILLLARAISKTLPLPRALALTLAVSSSAYLTTAPVTAWHFGRVAPVALISNLAAAPLCGAILLSGFATILLEPIPGLGEASARLAHGSVEILLAVAEVAAGLPGSSFLVPPPSPWLLSIHFLLVSVLSGLMSRTRMLNRGTVLRRLTLLSIVVLLVYLHLGPMPPTPPLLAKVYLLDVGQAQSVLLRGPTGGCVLVDAAGTSGGRFDAGERIVAPLLRRFGCRRLDALLLTHDHDDHAGGAGAILEEFPVSELWLAAGTYGRERTRSLVEAARAKDTAVVQVERGYRAVRAGMELEVFHPTSEDEGLDTNNRSLVVRASTKRCSILIPGDLEGAGERSLLAGPLAPKSQVLVVGHHGSRNGSSPAFLGSVRPEVALISAGAWSRFGHPDPGVLERLRNVGARIYRTDRDGLVRLECSEEGWRVEAYRRGEKGATER